MRSPAYSGQFKRDVKAAQKRGKDMSKLKDLATQLLVGCALPDVYQDHRLQGRWHSFREAHIEPDWLLIYKVAREVVRFGRTGRHTDLFNE